MRSLGSLAELYPAEHHTEGHQTQFLLHVHDRKQESTLTASYQDLESVQKRGGVCQAAILLVGGVVLWNVTIRPGAQEDFLNATGEGVAQVLHRVHHHTAVDCGA